MQGALGLGQSDHDRRPASAEASATDAEADAWRAATLDQLIRLVVVGGTFLLVVSFLTTSGGVWINATSLGIVLLVGVVGRARRLPLRARSLFMVGGCLAVSALATMLRGPVPAAILLVAVGSVVAALLLGTRAAMAAMALGSVSFLALGVLHRDEAAARLAIELHSVAPWARMAAATALLTTLVVLTLGRTLTQLQASLAEAQAALLRAQRESSARAQAEASQQVSEAQLRLALDAASVATWEVDLSTGAVSSSANMSRVLGLAAAAVPRTTNDVLALIHPDDRAQVAARMATDPAPPTDPVEVRLALPDGRVVWTESRFSRTPNRLLGVVMDVTERRRIEEAVRKQEAAQEASRVKTEFLSSMSHEIRTPLNAVLGFSHLVLQTPLTEQQRGYVSGIETASQALLAVINDVLDLSKIEAGKLVLTVAPFAVHDLRARVERILSVQAAKKEIALRFTVAADVPAVLESDFTRLAQVLINLASNSVKFTERGTVEVAIDRVDAGGVARAATNSKVTVRFCVRDTGIGMTAAQVGKLFEPFTQATPTTAQRYGGTGLGLAISRRIVEQMGGRIDVESAPSVGTTISFALELGAASLSAQPTAASTATPALPRLSDLRVLVVDDVAINRQVAREILESAGAKVDFAVDGAQAVRAVTGDGVAYGAVLMDVQMPVMDGLEATRRIRAGERGQDVPIIAITAHVFEAERRKCLDAGMTDYLAKPIDPQSLLTLLARVVSGATPPG